MASESFKRRGPKAVEPLILDGVRYEVLRRARAHGFAQSGGVIAAVDEKNAEKSAEKSAEKLWVLQVYQTEFTDEEQDAQEVYITGISLDADRKSLLIVNERKQRFRVYLSDRKVEPLGN